MSASPPKADIGLILPIRAATDPKRTVVFRLRNLFAIRTSSKLWTDSAIRKFYGARLTASTRMHRRDLIKPNNLCSPNLLTIVAARSRGF